MNYKFLDVGCKIGGSFKIAKKFGYKFNQGLGIDINKNHVENFKSKGFNAIVASATDIPFKDNSFELVIFNHVLEHLPTEDEGKKALDECLRVSSKYVVLGLPFFDEDEYINSLGFKTFYSDWTGHPNKVHLKKIQEEYLKGYNYTIDLRKKITDSSFSEIIPITAPKDSHDYDEKNHGIKNIIKFEKDIWREFIITISK